MKRPIFLICLLTAICSQVAYGQQDDSVKTQRQVLFYKQSLGVTDDQARRLNEIHEQYKSALKAITDNGGISETGKRRAAEQLMAEKNKKLNALLGAGQLDVVVPSSERKPVTQRQKPRTIMTSEDSVQLCDHLSKTLVIPKDKAQQVMFVELSYKEQSKLLLGDSILAEDVKRYRLSQLIRERNEKLKQLLTAAQLSMIVPPSAQ